MNTEQHDEISPHPLPLEEIRVIEEGDARTFAVQAVVFVLEERASGDYSEAVLLNDAPVPVVGEDGHQIGWASLALVGNKVVATAHIDYHCPERLNIETQRVWAHPAIETYMDEGDEEARRRKKSRGEDLVDPPLVNSFEVISIRLLSGVRAGDLPPVGSPIL
jgi:hypothetical protein